MKVDVLAVMEAACAALDVVYSQDDLRKDLGEARAAIDELIEADNEYDAANLALRTLDARDFDTDEAVELEYDALCQRFDDAVERRANALAKVKRIGRREAT